MGGTIIATITRDDHESHPFTLRIERHYKGKVFFISATCHATRESAENAAKAKGLAPMFESEMFGKSVMLFEGVSRERFEGLGELSTPSVADLFVAKITEARS